MSFGRDVSDGAYTIITGQSALSCTSKVTLTHATATSGLQGKRDIYTYSMYYNN
jgi:hypothetical protein